jgi:hypothetical protein
MRMTEKFCREQESLQIAKAAAEPEEDAASLASEDAEATAVPALH